MSSPLGKYACDYYLKIFTEHFDAFGFPGRTRDSSPPEGSPAAYGLYYLASSVHPRSHAAEQAEIIQWAYHEATRRFLKQRVDATPRKTLQATRTMELNLPRHSPLEEFYLRTRVVSASPPEPTDEEE